jgi:hypothetical protein
MSAIPPEADIERETFDMAGNVYESTPWTL